MRLEFGEPVLEFVGRELDVQICPPATAMGIVTEAGVVTGVVFNQYNGRDIHGTIAGHLWTRGFVRAIGHYVFVQLGCLRLTGVTEQPGVVRLVERLGGQVEGCLRDHFGRGRDGFIVGILKDEWKF